MLNAYLEYCLDGYCTVRETIDSLNSLTADLLHKKIKRQLPFMPSSV